MSRGHYFVCLFRGVEALLSWVFFLIYTLLLFANFYTSIHAYVDIQPHAADHCTPPTSTLVSWHTFVYGLIPTCALEYPAQLLRTLVPLHRLEGDSGMRNRQSTSLTPTEYVETAQSTLRDAPSCYRSARSRLRASTSRGPSRKPTLSIRIWPFRA